MTDEGETRVAFAPPDIEEADVEAVAAVLRSGWITTGQECVRLEEELAERLGVPHVVTLASCTAALETAFAYLGLAPGARVGVPTWTFVASALAPAKHGAVPVLLDVDADSLNVSAAALEGALEDGLDAVVVVHFGGVPVDKAIHDMCRDRGVPVVEDAAHALGASDHRGAVSGSGTVGAAFSFYATKNLTSAEGGALATDDETLANFARSYRLHGLSSDAWRRYEPGADASYDLIGNGIKANLPDVLAALARSQLSRFDDLQQRRRRAVLRYRERLASVAGVRFVPGDLVEGSADHLMVVVLPDGVDRAAVVQSLNAAGVGSSVHFQPLHRFAWLRDHSLIARDGVGVADSLADRVLSLPLHPRLTDGDVDRVCEALVSALR